MNEEFRVFLKVGWSGGLKIEEFEGIWNEGSFGI